MENGWKRVISILNKNAVAIAIIIALILVSIFICGRNAKEPEFGINAMAIEDLDSKKENVLKFTGISAGLSTAITLIHDDIGTPIADELAELTDYFLLILAAITTEKYMVTISGFTSFYILIPLGLILLIADMFSRRINFSKIGARLILFGILFYALVPSSCFMSNIIEDTYNESITIAEQQSEQAKQQIEAYEDGSIVEKVKNAYATLKDTLKNALNRQIEVVAVMIVTCCIIPLAVVFIFFWFMRTVLNVEARYPDFRKMARRMPKVNAPVRRMKAGGTRLSPGEEIERCDD